MDFIALSTIAIASAVNSAVPGPCVALTIGRAAGAGFQAGVRVLLGIVFAKIVTCGLTLAIIQGVMAVSPMAFVAMKWFGIVLLVVLSIRLLKPRSGGSFTKAGGHDVTYRDLGAGVLVGLASPFNLIFLLALLPQLVPSETLDFPSVALIMLATVLGTSLSLFCAAALGVLSANIVDGASRQIERIGAFCMIGFAGLMGFTPLV